MPSKFGPDSSNWKGGVRFNNSGYILIYSPNHPYCTKNKLVREHRLVYEHYLKILFDEDIYIPRNIEIDHINENVQDNSLINLQPLIKKEHRIKHFKKDTSDRFCLLCDDKTYTDKDGHEQWTEYLDGYICNKCYIKEYRKNKKLKRS